MNFIYFKQDCTDRCKCWRFWLVPGGYPVHMLTRAPVLFWQVFWGLLLFRCKNCAGNYSISFPVHHYPPPGTGSVDGVWSWLWEVVVGGRIWCADIENSKRICGWSNKHFTCSSDEPEGFNYSCSSLSAYGVECSVCVTVQHSHSFSWKTKGLSVDARMGWRMWTRFMWWAFVNSHITDRCHKIVSTSRATVNLSRRTSCHMVGLYKSWQIVSYVQKILYFIASAENLVNCVVWNCSFRLLQLWGCVFLVQWNVFVFANFGSIQSHPTKHTWPSYRNLNWHTSLLKLCEREMLICVNL